MPRRKGVARQLLEYLFAWRRREAMITIHHYDFLVASHSDQYRADEDESPRPESALGSDDARLLRPVTVLKDCA